MALKDLFGDAQEPTLDEVHQQQGRRPSAVEAVADGRRKKSVSNREITGASQITARQSIVPVALVTCLFFLWGFACAYNSLFTSALEYANG